MVQKHTPGPWMVNPDCAQVDCAVLSEKGGLLPVARLLWPTEERSEEETEANAWLIAAAPELLETLLSVRAVINGPDAEWWMSEPTRGGFDVEQIDAALAKAGGPE